MKRFAIPHEKLLVGLLLGFSFFLPLSIGLTQFALLLALPFWLWRLVRGRSRLVRSCPLFWPMAAFALVMVLISAQGVRPAASLLHCRRILYMSVVFMIGDVFSGASDSRDRRLWPLRAFLLGALLQGSYDLVRILWGWSRGINLYDLGNMRDPQMYMTALFLGLAAPALMPRYVRGLRLTALGVYAAGLLLHFKRGVWAAFAGAALMMAVRMRRRRIAGLVLLALLCAWALPPVRTRVDMLRREWSVEHGGRMALWLHVGPALMRAHPGGMGFLATRAEDFRGHGVYVEPRLNHLHNNVLQVILELNAGGLIVWLVWMGMTWAMLYRLTATAAGRIRGAAFGCWGAFCGLMLNGLVEYNFGTSQVFMLLLLLMGTGWAMDEAVT